MEQRPDLKYLNTYITQQNNLPVLMEIKKTETSLKAIECIYVYINVRGVLTM